MHYKQQKGQDSCKCYCYIELDELLALKEGKCALEVYRKPADYSRKVKPVLLSKKALYLHMLTEIRVG